MKKTIDVYEHMGEILKRVRKGVLITGKASGRINSMTISWGMTGIEWGKPVLLLLSEKTVLPEVFWKRMVNLQSAFLLMTVRRKFLDFAVQNQEEM